MIIQKWLVSKGFKCLDSSLCSLHSHALSVLCACFLIQREAKGTGVHARNLSFSSGYRVIPYPRPFKIQKKDYERSVGCHQWLTVTTWKDIRKTAINSQDSVAFKIFCTNLFFFSQFWIAISYQSYSCYFCHLSYLPQMCSLLKGFSSIFNRSITHNKLFTNIVTHIWS